MAVNKNFVVKNGLEVDTNTLFVDSANNRVAIGTTVPTASLDVRGKILSDSQVESWVGCLSVSLLLVQSVSQL